MSGSRMRHQEFLNSLERLNGRVAVVTGANSGLGFEVACGLAERGAEVFLAARNAERNTQALRQLRQRVPSARVRAVTLDLASLASIRHCVEQLKGDVPAVDILVNNAGVMGLSTRQETQDGFELQFGVNYLGHFALTGRLKPLLEAAPRGGGVVVGVASLAAWKGRLHFDDLQSRHCYSPFGAYRQSKLADLIFTLELARRAQARGWRLHVRAAHPGWASTKVVTNGPGSAGPTALRWLYRVVGGGVFRTFGQPATEGAEPILYAAAAAWAEDGHYYGPDGPGERFGVTGPAVVPPMAVDPVLARRLWEVSERLTGVRFG